ncbi:hypothetical protein DFJ73DRAFT_377090 [Zopfochytrium polystomum]|nr:hypothetical protein DFJ73DRAFT_377090 [Zopfochytrium polystomum]
MSYQLKEGSPATESKTNRLLQKQVDELKKVWSHELSANNILRNLIAKIQADSIYAEEEGRKQQIRLRQEFDELVALFDETNQDAVVLREDVSMRDRMLKDLEHRTDERLNAQFLDLEQQHQEQTQQLEEMYEKERTALNQLVLNLEKERDRLQAEFAAVKLSLGERLAEAIRSSESAFTRAREAERAREDADRELSMAREDIRMMEDAIAKLRSDASVREGVDRELKDIEIRFERRERNLIDELKHIERRLADREAELANERRLFDKRFGEREAFWIAETKARDQELIALRENAKMFGHERLEQTIRHLQADKDQLENSLYGKERQVQTLEVRVQELLQMEGDMIPLYEVRRREADLERGLQDQIRELQSQLTNSEEVCASFKQAGDSQSSFQARRLMEAQFLFERDRSRKLTSKNDELKRKYIQQRHQLQQQDEAINSALRPGPRGGDEVHILRRELLQSRQFSSGIVNIIREALVNTMGEVSIDIEDSETRMVRVDILR